MWEDFHHGAGRRGGVPLAPWQRNGGDEVRTQTLAGVLSSEGVILKTRKLNILFSTLFWIKL